MALGFVIGVTVIGVALFLAFLGVLARYAGLWSWAWNRLMATKEEKIKLCHPEEPVPTGGRPYLVCRHIIYLVILKQLKFLYQILEYHFKSFKL